MASVTEHCSFFSLKEFIILSMFSWTQDELITDNSSSASFENSNYNYMLISEDFLFQKINISCIKLSVSLCCRMSVNLDI